MISVRWYWLGLTACSMLIAIAYFYFQQTLGLPPCPLCMFQRACLVAIGGTCLIGIVFRPKKIFSKLLAFSAMLFSGLGLAIAGRQVWLQHLPADQVPECGPDLAYLMAANPFADVISKVFQGSGECAEVQWRLLSFSMPEWMLLVFLVMLVIAFRLLVSKERSYFSGNYGR